MSAACPQCASETEPGAVVCVQCGPPTLVDSQKGQFAEGGIPLGDSVAAAPASFQPTLLDSNHHLEGISGWLILVAIGLVFSPLLILGRTLAANVPLFTNIHYHEFLESHPALEGLILFEIATNLIFVAFLLALNFLFFTRRKAFPTYMILYLALQLVIIVGDTIAAHAVLRSAHIAESAGAVARSLAAACIWIPYLLVSRRVKVTFVQ